MCAMNNPPSSLMNEWMIKYVADKTLPVIQVGLLFLSSQSHQFGLVFHLALAALHHLSNLAIQEDQGFLAGQEVLGSLEVLFLQSIPSVQVNHLVLFVRAHLLTSCVNELDLLRQINKITHLAVQEDLKTPLFHFFQDIPFLPFLRGVQAFQVIQHHQEALDFLSDHLCQEDRRGQEGLSVQQVQYFLCHPLCPRDLAIHYFQYHPYYRESQFDL